VGKTERRERARETGECAKRHMTTGRTQTTKEVEARLRQGWPAAAARATSRAGERERRLANGCTSKTSSRSVAHYRIGCDAVPLHRVPLRGWSGHKRMWTCTWGIEFSP
jgi:hypothetical protein